MDDKITINGQEFVSIHQDKIHGDKLIIGIVDNRGLMLVGYTDMEKDDDNMITIRDSQCIVYWPTQAHINYLVNGACKGLKLGAIATVRVKEFYFILELPFDNISSWKKVANKQGELEIC